MHVELQLLADSLDVLEPLLIIRPSATDPDLDLVLDEELGKLAEGADDALEGTGDVGEVGDAAADEKDLAVRLDGGAEHEVEDGAGVVVGLRLGRGARVFAVVGEFVGEAGGGDGVGVDDRGAASRDQRPYAAVRVQDGEFEGGAGLGVQLGDVGFFFAQLAAEGGGELHGRAGVDADFAVGFDARETEGGGATGDGPFDAAFELGGLVEFGGEVEEVDFGRSTFGVGDDHEWVDLEVGELTVNVDGVKSGDEVDQDVVNALGYLLQQCRRDRLICWVFRQVNWDEYLLRLGVNITNVDTTLMGE